MIQLYLVFVSQDSLFHLLTVELTILSFPIAQMMMMNGSLMCRIHSWRYSLRMTLTRWSCSRSCLTRPRPLQGLAFDLFYAMVLWPKLSATRADYGSINRSFIVASSYAPSFLRIYCNFLVSQKVVLLFFPIFDFKSLFKSIQHWYLLFLLLILEEVAQIISELYKR